jgi:hypothetical protein
VDNWRSQLASQYEGPIEFIFVAESEDDAGAVALKQLLYDVAFTPVCRSLACSTTLMFTATVRYEGVAWIPFQMQQ